MTTHESKIFAQTLYALQKNNPRLVKNANNLVRELSKTIPPDVVDEFVRNRYIAYAKSLGL